MATDITLPGETEMMLLEMGGIAPFRHPPLRIGEAFARLLRGRFIIDGNDVGVSGQAEYSAIELNAIIRAALTGGGGGKVEGKAVKLDQYDVSDLMEKHVHTLPLRERWDLALAALGARIEGVASTDGAD